MQNIDFLILHDSVNHNYYVNISSEDRMKVVHLDEFDSDMLQSIDLNISQAISVDTKNFILFLHLRVVCENNLKQGDFIHDNNYSFSEIEVYI